MIGAFLYSVIKEQGITFGIIVVKEDVLRSTSEASKMRQFGIRAFGNMPIILMAQNYRGVPTYMGRPDIAKFLAGISYSRIPWKRYTVN